MHRRRYEDAADPADPRAGATAGGVVAAAIGLTLAGVLSPIAVAVAAAANAFPWPPLVASALIGLLVLTPAGVGVATALVGLRRAAARAAQAGSEAEYATLRVIVVALLFWYSLARGGQEDGAAVCIALVAPWLVGAWVMLLYVMHVPAVAAARRHAAIAVDLAAFSGFLHLGGSEVAGWYPLYLAATFYFGLRFGTVALAIAAGVSLAGFVGVVLTTAVWQQQPSLAAGLVGAIALLPAFAAATIRSNAAAIAEAARARAERQDVLLLIADALRGAQALAGAELASRIRDALDFASLEAGAVAAEIESFDLRAVIRASLGPLQEKAAGRGGLLRWRVDARLPYRLRGQAQTLARVVGALAEHAVEAASAAPVRVAIDGGRRVHDSLELQIRVETLGAQREIGDPAMPLGVRIVERLIAAAGGSLASERHGQRPRLTALLPLQVEAGSPGPVLDLRRRPVLLVTEDDALAQALAEPLGAWNAEPLWAEDAEQGIADLDRYGSVGRPIVIVDGRDRLLSSLAVAHQAARSGRAAPFVLLVAEEGQIAGLIDADEGELDGFIPAPVSEQTLANAIHALPLDPGQPQPAPERRRSIQPRSAQPNPERPVRPAPERPSAGEPASAARITPIAAHPKYASETPVDLRVVEGLRALADDPGFLGEVIETFRADAREIVRRLDEAAAAADPARFARGLLALHRAAGTLGGAQLCELAASLQRLTAADLRQQGSAQVRRIEAEIERLTTALADLAPAAAANRSSPMV